jgi:hypothetical protein
MPSTRFDEAVAEFDRQNAADPNVETVAGVARPRELVQAERLSTWVERLAPDASEALRLAARCQHVRRWEIARASFPEGRAGYLQWRTRLGRFHAEVAEHVLRHAGYDASTIDEVRRIVTKQGLRSNPDVQTMEDALCLAFLEHEIGAFAEKHDDDKLIEILKKTWKKMSPRAHELALALDAGPRVRALLERALAPGT